MSEKYLEGSKKSRKISRHDLAPNELKKYLEILKMFLSTSNKKILVLGNRKIFRKI
jgi:hypothetical protein